MERESHWQKISWTMEKNVKSLCRAIQKPGNSNLTKYESFLLTLLALLGLPSKVDFGPNMKCCNKLIAFGGNKKVPQSLTTSTPSLRPPSWKQVDEEGGYCWRVISTVHYCFPRWKDCSTLFTFKKDCSTPFTSKKYWKSVYNRCASLIYTLWL